MKIEITPAEIMLLRQLSLGKCEDIDCNSCPLHGYCSPEIANQSIVDLARFLFIIGDIQNDNN